MNILSKRYQKLLDSIYGFRKNVGFLTIYIKISEKPLWALQDLNL